jgi:gamma-glutamylaminecyclotransferase
MESNLFFVYGTLKRGFSNHWLLRENDATLIAADACTVEDYHLYVTGLPFVVDRNEESPRPAVGGHRIQGEVWQANDERTIEALDRLEGHPGFYERRLVNVEISDEGERVEAWLYFHPMTVRFEGLDPVDRFDKL